MSGVGVGAIQFQVPALPFFAFKGRNYQSYEFIQKNAGKVRVAGAPLATRLDRRASDHTIVILKGLKVP